MILPERSGEASGAHWIRSGRGDGPISVLTQVAQLLLQLLDFGRTSFIRVT